MTEETKRYSVRGRLKESGEMHQLWQGDLTPENADEMLTTAAKAFHSGCGAFLNLYGTLINVPAYAVLEIKEAEK